jgi:hypothetical protein
VKGGGPNKPTIPILTKEAIFVSRFDRFDITTAKSLQDDGNFLIVTDNKNKVHRFGPYKNKLRRWKDGSKIVRLWKRIAQDQVNRLGGPRVF